MNSVRLGYRRLYKAVGCSLSGIEELTIPFFLNDRMQVEVYIGSKPKFGTSGVLSNRYALSDKIPMAQLQDYSLPQSNEPAWIFTEIICSIEITIETTQYEAIVQNKQEATNQILALSQSHEEFQIAANLTAGIIGLRYHAQFVTELITENHFWAIDSISGMNISTKYIKLLQPIALTDTGINSLIQSLQNIKTEKDESWKTKSSLILTWLMRAWEQSDNVNRFMALFIPVEIILSGYSNAKDTERRAQAKTIRQLLTLYGGDQSQELLDLFNKAFQLIQRPTLVERFEILADEAKLPGWEQDIIAFKSFNKTRNNLVHSGDADIVMQITVDEDEVRILEELVERYVNYSLFEDLNFYSRDDI